MRVIVRCLWSLVALLALAAAVGAADAKAEAKADATDSFQSGGKKVAVERFEPKGKGKHPALVMVHGSDGMTRHGKAYRQAARDLARRGYIVFLVHYFNRTGTKTADKATISKNFLAWMGTLRDALQYAAKRPGVDRERVGMIGYSLGAYLSLSVAGGSAEKGQVAVKCVVEYFGGLPAVMGAFLKQMPPVLILHGEDDEVVPVKEAKDLAALLDKKKLPYEMKLYPKQKHGFTGEDAEDAAERVYKFLGKHLSGKKTRNSD
jgi:carboxymethylenebutenolidase